LIPSELRYYNRTDEGQIDQEEAEMRAKTTLVVSAAILAMLTIASAQQVSRSGQWSTQYSRQPSPAWPYGDDAARYQQTPQWGPAQPKPYSHKINPGGVGTHSAAQR
jgi:hypothetical protein